jgi:hypothetical protein
MALVDSTGVTVAKQTGGSPDALSAAVPAGHYSLVLSAASNASFTLTVKYPQA